MGTIPPSSHTTGTQIGLLGPVPTLREYFAQENDFGHWFRSREQYKEHIHELYEGVLEAANAGASPEDLVKLMGLSNREKGKRGSEYPAEALFEAQERLRRSEHPFDVYVALCKRYGFPHDSSCRKWLERRRAEFESEATQLREFREAADVANTVHPSVRCSPTERERVFARLVSDLTPLPHPAK